MAANNKVFILSHLYPFSRAFLDLNDSEIECFDGSISDERITVGLENEEGENFELRLKSNSV